MTRVRRCKSSQWWCKIDQTTSIFDWQWPHQICNHFIGKVFHRIFFWEQNTWYIYCINPLKTTWKTTMAPLSFWVEKTCTHFVAVIWSSNDRTFYKNQLPCRDGAAAYFLPRDDFKQPPETVRTSVLPAEPPRTGLSIVSGDNRLPASLSIYFYQPGPSSRKRGGTKMKQGCFNDQKPSRAAKDGLEQEFDPLSLMYPPANRW